MAKQPTRNYGADTSLIQGEAAMRQTGGFQDYSKAFDAPIQRLQQAARQREAREQQRNAKVESYISALNANIDVTALTETDQKAVNQYLMGVKDEYAEAANAIVNFKPGTPEYMEQLDIMNGVKNSLANLKGELDGYQESKANYIDSFKDQSAGNNSLQADNAANIFTGETPFSIGTGGHLFFKGQDGTNMAYKDVKMPFKKDYKAAMDYNDLFTPIYNSGSYDSTKQKIFEDRIRAMMSANPDGMRSIIADQLSSFGDYQDLIPLLDDPASLETVTDLFVQRASEAARKTAAEGKAQKNKNNPQGGNGRQGTKYPTPSAVKTGFVNGKEVDYGWGYDDKGNTVKYYTIDGGKTWSTSAPGTTTTPPSSTNNTPPEENNEFAGSRDEDIKNAIASGIDPKEVIKANFPDQPELTEAEKKKYNIK